mgnify:CR=1 FL=1
MSIKLALVIVVPIIMGIISTYCTVNLYSDNLEDTTELRLIVAIWLGVFGSIGILVKMIWDRWRKIMSKTFTEIVITLFIGASGTAVLFEVEPDIVRRVLVFLYWVLIAWTICECIKSGNDASTIRTNIRETLESNYSGSTDYKDQTFVYDGKKYSYDYNDETNMLIVFDGTGTVVNSILIDGANQDTIDSKAVVSETETESAVTEPSTESSTTDSTAVSENQEGLAKRIQDKIQERYINAVITSFDTTNLAGTFESDTGDYGFSWSDNMLEIFNLENKDQNVYYKVSVSYEVD